MKKTIGHIVKVGLTFLKSHSRTLSLLMLQLIGGLFLIIMLLGIWTLYKEGLLEGDFQGSPGFLAEKFLAVFIPGEGVRVPYMLLEGFFLSILHFKVARAIILEEPVRRAFFSGITHPLLGHYVATFLSLTLLLEGAMAIQLFWHPESLLIAMLKPVAFIFFVGLFLLKAPLALCGVATGEVTSLKEGWRLSKSRGWRVFKMLLWSLVFFSLITLLLLIVVFVGALVAGLCGPSLAEGTLAKMGAGMGVMTTLSLKITEEVLIGVFSAVLYKEICQKRQKQSLKWIKTEI